MSLGVPAVTWACNCWAALHIGAEIAPVVDGIDHTLKPLENLSKDLFLKDKAFFYRAFVVEEIQ